MTRPAYFLLAAIAVAHLSYFTFPEALQARVFYIGRGLEGMGLFGLLLLYGPRLTLWAGACLWGYLEEFQTAICRIATFSEPPGSQSMICVGLLGIKPYAAILAASLALLAMGVIKPWPHL